MYSWGGSTSDWKKPTNYKYDDARKPYLDSLASTSTKRGGRSYALNRAPNMDLVDPLGKKISSNSKNPIIVAIDVTGSMDTWPGEIFDRLPLMYQTLSQYKQDVEICFCAIGDANSDVYPLQVNDFEKGVALEDKIKALGAEGGGGGQISETYELFAYFIDKHCKLPNAKSPFLLIYGDEKFYNKVSPEQAEHYIGDKLQGKLESAKVWKSLMQKFNLFYLQKPYGGGYNDGTTEQVKKHWAKVIGKQKIVDLPSCERAVDVAIGLIAKHWGEFSDFDDNMSARQDDSEKELVKESLRFIPDSEDSSNSVVFGTSAKSKSASLSEMYDKAKSK